jgi:hypothetical protein
MQVVQQLEVQKDQKPRAFGERCPAVRLVVNDVEAVNAHRAVILEKRRKAKDFIPASREQPNLIARSGRTMIGSGTLDQDMARRRRIRPFQHLEPSPSPPSRA